jgi:hypothetical protein
MSNTIQHLLHQLKNKFPEIEDEYAQNLLCHFIQQNSSNPLRDTIKYIEDFKKNEIFDISNESKCCCCKKEFDSFLIYFTFCSCLLNLF